MMKAAIAFFVLALVAILVGATGVAGLSLKVGKALLIVFLILSIVSFFVGTFGSGNKNA